MANLLAVALGGAAGALVRYAVGVLSRRWLGGLFAYGTLVVNVVGCFLLGLLWAWSMAAAGRWSPTLQAGLGVGFLGALTTFSTFGLETYVFYAEGRFQAAAVNVGANVILGMLAVALGVTLGQRLTA